MSEVVTGYSRTRQPVPTPAPPAVPEVVTERERALRDAAGAMCPMCHSNALYDRTDGTHGQHRRVPCQAVPIRRLIEDHRKGLVRGDGGKAA